MVPAGEYPHVVRPPGRLTAAVLVLAILSLAAACGPAGPSQSVASLPPPPAEQPSLPPDGSTAPPVIGTPVDARWPAGWDTAFCEMFGQLVETQELAVDIGRALDEGARRDARALTAELADSITLTRELLADIPEWSADEMLREDVNALLDLGERMADRYERHLDNRRRQPLRAARAAGAEMAPIAEQLLDKVVLLSDQGLSCPGVEFHLETPPSE